MHADDVRVVQLGGSAGFALVLLVIALAVLRHACLLCLTLDGVILAWAVTVVPLARRFTSTAATPLLSRRSTAHAVLLLGLLGAAGLGTVEAMRAPAEMSTVEEVRAAEPKFYAAWQQLPVVPMQDVLGEARHVKGAADAPITIVEFSDFQCPACGHAFADLRDLVKARRDVRLVFRHYPLDAACNSAMPQTLHPDACAAAIASECASDQGRFWEYHDLLFTHQSTLDRESLFRYARDVGLDIDRFRTCLDSPDARARVTQDVDAGTRLEIDSTPTLFINGRRLQGALDRAYWNPALVIEKDRLAQREPAADPR